MRLGFKSKVLLDMILTAGLDAMVASTFPTSSLMKAGGWEEEKYLVRHLRVLEDEGWIVWDDSKETGKWVLRITRGGKNALTGDFDPLTAWSR